MRNSGVFILLGVFLGGCQNSEFLENRSELEAERSADGIPSLASTAAPIISATTGEFTTEYAVSIFNNSQPAKIGAVASILKDGDVLKFRYPESGDVARSDLFEAMNPSILLSAKFRNTLGASRISLVKPNGQVAMNSCSSDSCFVHLVVYRGGKNQEVAPAGTYKIYFEFPSRGRSSSFRFNLISLANTETSQGGDAGGEPQQPPQGPQQPTGPSTGEQNDENVPQPPRPPAPPPLPPQPPVRP